MRVYRILHKKKNRILNLLILFEELSSNFSKFTFRDQCIICKIYLSKIIKYTLLLKKYFKKFFEKKNETKRTARIPMYGR